MAGGGEIVGWHCTKRGGKSADSEPGLVRRYAKAESKYSMPILYSDALLSLTLFI